MPSPVKSPTDAVTAKARTMTATTLRARARRLRGSRMKRASLDGQPSKRISPLAKMFGVREEYVPRLLGRRACHLSAGTLVRGLHQARRALIGLPPPCSQARAGLALEGAARLGRTRAARLTYSMSARSLSIS